MALRRKVFDQCVLPTITYGAETWTTTKLIEHKLRTAQRAKERQMLHISIIRDRIKCTEIRKKTGERDIIRTIKQAEWRWAGHTARRNDNRWTTRIMDWQPRTGKRKRGRQRRKWRDDIRVYAGTTWTRTARNRNEWHFHDEGYILHWMNTA